MERPFRTPMVPIVPILGVISAFYLMIDLPLLTWEVVGIWLVIGLGHLLHLLRQAQQGASASRRR